MATLWAISCHIQIFDEFGIAASPRATRGMGGKAPTVPTWCKSPSARSWMRSLRCVEGGRWEDFGNRNEQNIMKHHEPYINSDVKIVQICANLESNACKHIYDLYLPLTHHCVRLRKVENKFQRPSTGKN